MNFGVSRFFGFLWYLRRDIKTYCKNAKNRDTKKNCCNYPKTGAVQFYYWVMGPKDVDGMANRSSLIWVCTVCPDVSVRKLRIITVNDNPTVWPIFADTWISVLESRTVQIYKMDQSHSVSSAVPRLSYNLSFRKIKYLDFTHLLIRLKHLFRWLSNGTEINQLACLKGPQPLWIKDDTSLL